jgi:hypothetical protein
MPLPLRHTPDYNLAAGKPLLSDNSSSAVRAGPTEICHRERRLDLFSLLTRFRGPLSLALLVVLNLALVFGLLLAAGRAAGAPFVPVWGMRIIAFALGVGLGDMYLVVLWLGLAGPKAILRYPLAGIVFLVGASSISRGLGIAQSGDGALLAAFAAIPVLTAHLPLLSLRWLLGWRLAFDASSYHMERAGKTQFYLAHCFWMMTLVALPLALYRSLAGMFREGEEIPAWTLAVIGALVMLAGISSTWVILATRRQWLPILVLLVVLCMARVGEHALDRLLVTGIVSTHWFLVAAMAGIALAVIINLGLLRAAGLQLLVLRPAKEQASA